MGVNIRSAVSECICPLSHVTASDAGSTLVVRWYRCYGGTVKHSVAGKALVVHGITYNQVTAASARSGAVSFRANPFLRNKSRLKSFRASSRTGLNTPVLASRSIVPGCDYYLLANTSFGMNATALFLGCKASISETSYADIRNSSRNFSRNFSENGLCIVVCI